MSWEGRWRGEEIFGGVFDDCERGVILRSSSCHVHVEGECEIDTIDSWSL